MLRWRLTLGVIIVAVLAALCWFDAFAARPGIYLAPLALILTPLATNEMSGFFRQQNDRHPGWLLHVGTFLPVLASCMPIFLPIFLPASSADCPVGHLGWLACGLAAAMLVALGGHMRLFSAQAKEVISENETAGSGRGNIITELALSCLAFGYVGCLFGFFIQIRLLKGGPWGHDGRWGMVAWLSLILVVKLSDIGQYTAGHLFGGRFFGRRLAPTLSPGKTWEGAIGGLVMAIVGAVIALGPLARLLECGYDQGGTNSQSGLSWWGGLVAYGLLVGSAGIFGDLSESMLKRSAGIKDSSQWLPGFGGVLDLLDSLLVAAPVAYACWLIGLVGP